MPVPGCSVPRQGRQPGVCSLRAQGLRHSHPGAQCQSLGWAPAPSERNSPLSVSNPDRQSRAPGEGGRSRAGKCRLFRGALAWEQIIHPPASVPKQVCALHLAAACKYFPVRCGMLFPGRSQGCSRVAAEPGWEPGAHGGCLLSLTTLS